MSLPVVIEEMTASWLSAALDGTIESFTAEPVGTGQIGTCYRLTLRGHGVPDRVIAKLPAVDPAAREMLANTYYGEVRFYRNIAPTVTIRRPACYFGEYGDKGAFVLLLEDLAPSRQGDQLVGCTVDQARDAVVNLAGLHGPRWCDPTLLELEGLSLNGPRDAATMAELYAPTNETFLEQIGPLLTPEDHETLRAVPPILEAWALARTERFGLVHGDYRVDNLLFPPDGGPGAVAVDWQTLSLALPARDLAYFIGTSLEPEVRREHEQDLVAAYHSALGVDGYSLEDAFDDYVFGMVQIPLVAVFALVYGARTERGDRMFAAMVSRGCAAMRDLGTLQLARKLTMV
ncbi:MAG TPA: phosphotransferase [Nocardioidaceae bacterium]|nr:phosphotransferase [Nocardioidaceae bacterium]